MWSELEFRQLEIKEKELESFEASEDFQENLDEAIALIKESLVSGNSRHGDSFTVVGLLGFANHTQRKAKDQYRLVAGGVDIGTNLTDCALDMATYSVLEIAYLIKQSRPL